MERKNAILNKSFEFALAIIKFSEKLENIKKFVIARQMLRSGTSIDANIREAQSAESNTDFIHKLKIAAKEAEETEYWLLLCKHSSSYPYNEMLLSQLREIQKLFSASIATSRKNNNKKNIHQAIIMSIHKAISTLNNQHINPLAHY